MTDSRRVALYCRVSTTIQNLQPQLDELREYCARRGLLITGEYCDHGISGSKDLRPALNRLMADAAQRRFDAVIVVKIDRWGRSLKHLVVSLAELNALGVSFISLRDNIDLSTASGRLMLQIIGAMAEFERELIRERVIAGQARAKARGKRFGRPLAIIDRTRILDARAKGVPWLTIARQLGVGVATCIRRARC
jgi:DNA invertase Pin-like site-specific DNA recombinase